MACNVGDFVRSCGVLADGFVGREQAAWRLGTVLMLRHGDALATVQKAAVDAGYQFQHAWSLPGGMVRARDWDGAQGGLEPIKLLRLSLGARAAAEAGIPAAACEGLRIADEFGPVVTSYTAKGETRFTLIAVQAAEVRHALDLVAQDRSVQDACWTVAPYDWERFAPANRVLVAHAVWSGLSEADRLAGMPPIGKAVAQCLAWGRAMGWDHLPAPWASPHEIVDWRMSWRKDQAEPLIPRQPSSRARRKT